MIANILSRFPYNPLLPLFHVSYIDIYSKLLKSQIHVADRFDEEGLARHSDTINIRSECALLIIQATDLDRVLFGGAEPTQTYSIVSSDIFVPVVSCCKNPMSASRNATMFHVY